MNSSLDVVNVVVDVVDVSGRKCVYVRQAKREIQMCIVMKLGPLSGYGLGRWEVTWGLKCRLMTTMQISVK